MPYSTTQSLPPSVKQKLKGKRRRQWMHVWNSSYSRHRDESRAFAEAWSAAQKGVRMSENFNFFLPLSKVERNKDGSVTVSGYASTPALDLDNEIVSLDAVKKALPGYWEWRNIREMHQPSAVGRGQEASVDDRGLFLSARVSDPTAAQKCVDKVYNGFSIGGRKLAKQGNTITEIEMVEISVVDRPANPECRFEVAKRFKDRGSAPAYLLKAASVRRDSASRALSKMAQAVEILAKDGPPAAHDGFSLPVKKSGRCAAHDVEDCEECAEKRDVGEKEREHLAGEGKALPGGGFPIKDKSDLENARQAVGRAKDPGKTRALIRRRAKELGVKLPDKWKKKAAFKLLKRAEKQTLAKRAERAKHSTQAPSFLTLSVDGGARTVEGLEKSGHELPPELELISQPREGGLLDSKTMRAVIEELSKRSKGMAQVNKDELGKLILETMAKAGKAPSRFGRMQIARGNMKKAKKVMKECSAALKSAHAMHKAAYIAKMAKTAGKKPKDNEPDADDFDHEEAMKFLQKAYGSLSTLKTFVKAADVQLKKATGRAGQRGQETSDGDQFYEVPRGIKDLGPGEMATMGPGGGESGSMPPEQMIDQHFPGKMAKRYSKYITEEEAAALQRAAAAEAKVEVLERMPVVTGKQKPYAFDTSKLGVGNGQDSTSLFKDVSPNSLSSDDEQIRKSAVGKVIGNMITQGHGRSVFDPNFHGTAGAA